MCKKYKKHTFKRFLNYIEDTVFSLLTPNTMLNPFTTPWSIPIRR